MRSGEGGRTARSLLAGGTEVSVSLSERFVRSDAGLYCQCRKLRKGWKRCWSRALRVGAGRIRVGVLMTTRVPLPTCAMAGVIVSRVILSPVIVSVVKRCRGLRIAQNNAELTIDRCEHEARRNEGAQQQHCQNQRCGPAGHAPPAGVPGV